jgi:hypothetical protein
MKFRATIYLVCDEQIFLFVDIWFPTLSRGQSFTRSQRSGLHCLRLIIPKEGRYFFSWNMLIGWPALRKLRIFVFVSCLHIPVLV